jgi:hypothetical protein
MAAEFLAKSPYSLEEQKRRMHDAVVQGFSIPHKPAKQFIGQSLRSPKPVQIELPKPRPKISRSFTFPINKKTPIYVLVEFQKDLRHIFGLRNLIQERPSTAPYPRNNRS